MALLLRSTPRRVKDVAISYATLDKEKATDLWTQLSAYKGPPFGLRIFMDEREDHNYVAQNLRAGLKRSFTTDTRLVVSIVSNNYFLSEACRFEWEVSTAHEKALTQAIPPAFADDVPGATFRFPIHFPDLPLDGDAKKRVEDAGTTYYIVRSLWRTARRIAVTIGNCSSESAYEDQFLWSTERAKEIYEGLLSNRVVQLIGRSGAGKTRLAFCCADELKIARTWGTWFLSTNKINFSDKDPRALTVFDALCNLLFPDWTIPEDEDLESKEWRAKNLSGSAVKTAQGIVAISVLAGPGWDERSEARLAFCITHFESWPATGLKSDTKSGIQALLILDNAESEPEGIAHLTDALACQPSLRILVTGQFRLPSLPLFIEYQGLDVRLSTPRDRASLDQLITVRRGTKLKSGPDDDALLKFLEENDFNAMLLELVSAASKETRFLKILKTLSDLKDRFTRREDRLWSVYAMSQYQYDRLSPGAQFLLRLTIFTDGLLTNEFLAWLSETASGTEGEGLSPALDLLRGTVDRDLQQLRDSGLLGQNVEKDLIARESILQYLRDEQNYSEDAPAFVDLLARFTERIQTLTGSTAQTDITPEYLPNWRRQWPMLKNLLSAADASTLDVEALVRVMDRAFPFAFSDGHLEELLAAVERYLQNDIGSERVKRGLQMDRYMIRAGLELETEEEEVRAQFDAAKSQGDMGNMLRIAGTATFAAFTNTTKAAFRLGEELVNACLADRKGMAEASGSDVVEFFEGLAMMRYKQGRFRESEEYAQTALTLYNSFGQRHQSYNCLNTVALSEVEVLQWQDAERHFNQVLQLAKQEDYPFWIGVSIWNLGYLYARQGKFAEAWQAFEDYFALSNPDEIEVDCDSLDWYAVLARAKGDLPLAIEFRALAERDRRAMERPETKWESGAFVGAMRGVDPEFDEAAFFEATNLRRKALQKTKAVRDDPLGAAMGAVALLRGHYATPDSSA